ncbi:hypothetical protein [Pseudoalteromonas luteoviolacea]|uniref:hypothetical protein n=1 Tax=Pseudoalteromonas luteoviolacea TaxID=43657 RepID=UPI00114F4204|nr:hypothetical protein [Pseudoalteromonas luteoviolacea]TQF67595.1 hypothetical protein FLM44_20650 [Pseudoalteromonas luteoviolacea]
MQLSKIALSVITLAAFTQANASEFDLNPAGNVQAYSPAKNMLNQQPQVAAAHLSSELSALDFSAQAQATPTAITPLCPTLATGNQYTLNGATAGSPVCYHFEITERSKTTALLFGQTGATNLDLSVIKHNPDDSLTVLGTSANTGTADEAVVALTEPGHYYWYMDVKESDGSPFNFGAVVSTQLDSYEFNDTVATATALSNGQNSITANMDSLTDIDLYQFTAVNGQDIVLNFNNNGAADFIFEVFNNGWVPISQSKPVPISGLQPNQVVTMRVRANTAVANNPNTHYNLSVASVVASFSNNSVSGESNVNRIPLSAQSNPYLTTQAYRNLTWGITLLDSTGAPIQNATATLRVVKGSDDKRHTFATDANGRISKTISLGTCRANINPTEHTEYSFGYRNRWRSQIELGAWQIVIPTNIDANNDGIIDTIGVGGPNVPFVYLGHICDQDLLSSERS